MLVLDTDLLTLVQRKEGDAYARLDARLEAASTSRIVAATMISFEEQMRGWLAYIAQSRTPERQVNQLQSAPGVVRGLPRPHPPRL